MKCVRIHEHGGVDKLLFEEVPDPKPGASDVLVKVAATSLNHMDLWVRKGLPEVQFPLPLIPGVDAVGTVASKGGLVDHLNVGDRVAVVQGISCGRCAECLRGDESLCRSYVLIGEHRDGADAEYALVPGRNVVPIPSAVSFESAAAAGVVFLTAWQMVVDKARVKPGDDVLVVGASSGVGSAAVQIAKLCGARVIATTSSGEKAAKASALGADEVINYSEENILKGIRRVTAKRGVDVVIEHVGMAVWEDVVRGLAKGGRLVTCGATSGYAVTTDLRYVFYKQLQILGSTMGKKGDFITILQLLAGGKLKPVIDRQLELKDVREAHTLLESGKVFGKIVLRV